MPYGELLEEFRIQGTLVDIGREGLGSGDLRGFVLGLSKKLVLVWVAGDGARHDGYAVINRGEISSARWGTDELRAWARTLGDASKGDPIAREVGLADWRAAIESAQAAAPLLTFHREREADRAVSVGRRVELTKHLVIADRVTAEGEEDGRFALPIADLTRLDFGRDPGRGPRRGPGSR